MSHLQLFFPFFPWTNSSFCPQVVLLPFWKPSGLVELVHFLRRQAQFCHGHGLILGEEEVVDLVVADADAVVDLIPVVVGIQAEAGLGLLGIIQAAAAARQMKAGMVMGQMALPYHINCLVVHLHGDGHIGVQMVRAAFNIRRHLLPLPAVPVGDMGDLRGAVQGFHLSQGGQLPLLTAGSAGQPGAFSLHSALGAAGCALVQDPVQAVGPEILGDVDIVFLLPAEVVEAEGVLDALAELPDGQIVDILPGEQHPGLCADLLVLADLQLIIEGIASEQAEGLDHHHWNIVLLQQDAHLPGQGGGRAVEGVAGLGIHQHGGLQRLEAILHVLDQPQIRHEFLGGDAADGPHEPAHQAEEADEAVIGGHDIERPGKQDPVGNLHIQETGVVHQDQAGLVLADAVQLRLVFEAGAHHAEDAQQPDQAAPEKIGLPGGLMGRPGQRHNGVIVQFLDGGLHKELLSWLGLWYLLFPHYTLRSQFRQEMFIFTSVFHLYSHNVVYRVYSFLHKNYGYLDFQAQICSIGEF